MGWSADDIPDLHGHSAVVTGANSGLGFHTALQLARHGADVTIAVRDAGRGEAALSRMRATTLRGTVTSAPLDLADPSSVQGFVKSYLAEHEGLDLLVNNAGVMAVPRAVTRDGFELQFGTNHLGHFALTGLLLPALLARPAARVVTVSSTAHRTGRIDFDDLDGERHYRKWTAYSQSKVANLLFMRELHRRAASAGVGLVSVAAHPGYAATNLQRRGPELEGSAVKQLGMRLANAAFAQSDAMGALPSLYAATAPDVRGGDYFGPNLFEWRGHPKRVGMSAVASDPEIAARLWDVSEERTGVVFSFG